MWKQKWKDNYNNVGDLAELPKFVKTVGFGAKKEAQYLGWGVVDRHFSLQDGTHELVRQPDGSTVEIDEVILRQTVDQETGEVRTVSSKSFFVNVKVSWEGREHIERYPIQNSSGLALQTFTQNDLNTSYQRAKTKAIAIVSGIGYWLYEGLGVDADQFTTVDPKETKVETKDDPKETKVAPKTTKVTKKEKEEEAKKITEELFDDKKEEVKVVEVGEEIDFNATDDDEVELTPEQVELYNDHIKSVFLGDKEKGNIIKAFLGEVGKSKFQEFTHAELLRLYNKVK